MYCPKCGTDNLETASFCRKCGVDLRLVPQALSGTLPLAQAEPDEIDDWSSRRRRRRKKEPTMEGGIKNVFMGLCFIFVALAVSRYMPGGNIWWFWMLIPAFSMLGGGVAELVRAKNRETQSLPPAQAQRVVQPASHERELPSRNTGELVQPPSITEGTTRLLETEAATRPIASPIENQRRES
ncbi:MAG TPA: zinc-ribbon domain-containing protein [Pyrinomonadaceae bacterium]|jgi:hypothetical protein